MQSTAADAAASDPHPAVPDSASAVRRAEGSLTSVEAALIDNHSLAPPLPSHSASQSPSFSIHSAARPSQLTARERWKCFALNVLTCIPPREQEQACEGFLQAMREVLAQAPSNDLSALRDDQSHADHSSRFHPQSECWPREPAPSQLLDSSRLERDILPRLEELLHELRSPR